MRKPVVLQAHTPGPWRFVDKIGWSGIETPDGEDLLLYASCEEHKGRMWHSRITFNRPADKKLIAAAPDLLEACKAKLAALKGEEYDPEAFDEAIRVCEAAIAKAESP